MNQLQFDILMKEGEESADSYLKNSSYESKENLKLKLYSKFDKTDQWDYFVLVWSVIYRIFSDLETVEQFKTAEYLKHEFLLTQGDKGQNMMDLLNLEIATSQALLDLDSQ